VFATAQPSLVEAIKRNPRAMLTHFLWNISLIPNGLQVLLFGATSGRVTPDYIPVQTGSKWVLFVSIAGLGVLLMGTYRLWRFRHFWWTNWLKDRVWIWLTLGALGLTTVAVMIIERPRPEYIFIMGLAIRGLAGMSVLALAAPGRRFPDLSPAFPVVAVFLICLYPSFYYQTANSNPRTLLKFYRRLAPFEKFINRPETTIVAPEYGWEICNYLAECYDPPSHACRGGGASCVGMGFWELRAAVSPSRPLRALLDQNRVNLFFADETILTDPIGRDFVLSAAGLGWSKIGGRDDADEKWVLLQKNTGHSATRMNIPR